MPGSPATTTQAPQVSDDDDDNEMSVDSDGESQGPTPDERERMLSEAHAVLEIARKAQLRGKASGNVLPRDQGTYSPRTLHPLAARPALPILCHTCISTHGVDDPHFEAQRRDLGKVTFGPPDLAGSVAPPPPASSKRQLPAAAPFAKRAREVEESDPALMLRTLEQ